MTLAQIYRLALRQLDEDPADIDEFKDLFAVYANQGYQIALRQYVKPKDTLTLRTDEDGIAQLDGLGIIRIISVKDENNCEVYAYMTEDGTAIRTSRRDQTLTAVCEVTRAPLEDDMDEPMLPLEAHAALADYICYKYLSTGNMAKQSRAQHYRTEFFTQMQQLRPQGSGGVTGYKNLYTVTDARWTR